MQSSPLLIHLLTSPFIPVNNAGDTAEDGIVYKPLEWSQAMMDVNFWGVVRTTRAVLPAMKKQKSGRILNVTSLAGLMGESPFTDAIILQVHI